MALADIPISENECIGDSLQTINAALTSLDLLISESGANVTVQETPPAGASPGDLWFDSSSGVLSIYYNDGNTSQWVVAVPGGGSGPLATDIASLTAILDDYFVPSSGGGGSFEAPVGYVGYYAATSAPTGWVECNGAALTVAMGSTYTDLRTFLINNGNPFGVSGSDPLIPDLRGKFIRSNGSDGTYTSGTFGTTQADAFKSHNHYYEGVTSGNSGAVGIVAGGGILNGHTFTNYNTSSTGSTETRPANIALLACIKL
jgi:microcystin-dependent protein